MSLAPGSRVGPYEILSPVGAGGMGTVWKAHDSRLNRDVAIKTSHAKFSERFEREARAIAALNHPNICQIYDVGPDYLVMEYIDGAPVAPVDTSRKLLDIAVQIAEGLAAAHAAGIVHRDLKPDNILITREGRIKILDFGLAKTAVADSTPDEATRTMAMALTDPGTTVGTIAYMSPEQARGNANLTAQSDQFSFGLVLYELAAGKRAFQRGSAAETMTAIIREDAEPLPAKVPAQFRWIVERLMAKEPAERYDSTRDLYRELRQVRDRLSETATSSGTAAASAVRAPSRRHVWIKAAAILVVGLIAGGFAMKWAASADAGIDPIRLTPIAMDTGEENDPVFSPDGNSIAYRRMETEVMVRSLNAIEPVSLVKAQYTVSNIVWTPDGSRVCYRLQGDFWCVGSAGGAPQELLPNMGEDNFLGSMNSAAQFTPDGKTLVFLKLVEGRNRLYASSPPGAEPRLVNGVALPATVAQLGPFAPDGAKLLATGLGTADSWVVPYPAGTPKKIDSADGIALAWLPDGRHVLVRGNAGHELLVADTQSQARRLLMRESAVAVTASVSPDGKRIAYSSGLWNPDVVEYSMDGKRIRPLVNSTRADGGGSWSPSGESFVYDSNVAGPMSIWTRKADGTGAVRIADTGIEAFLALARYSPDGRRIAYPSSAGIDVIPASGGRAVQVVASETRLLYLCWSADGQWIWYVKDGSLWRAPSQGGTPVDMNRSATAAGEASADGRWVSYTAVDGIHLLSPDGKQDRLVHAERASGLGSQFGEGGKVLYLLRASPSSLTVLDVESGRVLRTVTFDVDPADTESALSIGSVSPDGKFVLLTTGGRQYDIWMMEGFAQPARGLLSWFRHWQTLVVQEPAGGSAE